MLTMRDLNKSLIQELLLVDLAGHNAHVTMKNCFPTKTFYLANIDNDLYCYTA